MQIRDLIAELQGMIDRGQVRPERDVKLRLEVWRNDAVIEQPEATRIEIKLDRGSVVLNGIESS